MDFKQKLEERLINFAVLAIEVANRLPYNRLGYHLGGQLLRSGTSPALIMERRRAPSRERISFINWA